MTDRLSKAERLIQLCDALGVEFWIAENDRSVWASVPNGDHVEHLELRTRDFANWAAGVFYDKWRTGLGRKSQEEAADALEGRTLNQMKRTTPLAVRVARGPCGRAFLDLGDPSWGVIAVERGEWREITNRGLGFAFRRPRGMQPLPTPARPGTGSLDALRKLLNVDSDGDWVMLVAFLLGCLWPDGPYPVLVITGDAGTAKSSTIVALRSVVDPHTVDHRALPKNPDDLNVGARNQWLLAYDNVSKIQEWQSDALCRLSTGSADATRGFHQQRDEMIYKARRPIIVSGIHDPITRADLLDRSLRVRLPEIKARVTEAEFLERLRVAVPKALGALLDAVATAEATWRDLAVPGLPRLADFGRFITAAEPALGWRPGLFLELYRGDRDRRAQELLRENPVAVALVKLLDTNGGQWKAPALKTHAELSNIDVMGLPETSRGTRVVLERLAGELRRQGIRMDLDATEGKGPDRRDVWHFWREAPSTDAPRESAPTPPTADIDLDDPLFG